MSQLCIKNAIVRYKVPVTEKLSEHLWDKSKLQEIKLQLWETKKLFGKKSE